MPRAPDGEEKTNTKRQLYFTFSCRTAPRAPLLIIGRVMDFTAEYGLIIGSYGFYCRLWIENPSGCKLVLAAERGIIKNIDFDKKSLRNINIDKGIIKISI